MSTNQAFAKNRINADNIVDYIGDIFARRGAESYLGERVSMAQHMLQAAANAELEGASAELVAAALLHDLGHYTNEIPDEALMKGTDNYHEEAGANFLEDYFPAAVVEPIRQHVATKRYLCAVDAEYFGRLSEASVYTLGVQGGPMSDEEVAAFERNPHLQSCIQVRYWDEAGKDPELAHPTFEHYRPLLESLVLRPGGQPPRV